MHKPPEKDSIVFGYKIDPTNRDYLCTLFFNPGSTGPRRFRLPITVGRMTAEHGKLRAEIVELSVEALTSARTSACHAFLQTGHGLQRLDCLAGHVRLEVRRETGKE
jgi:hypothetical protein